jgi:hypothetical protein
MARTPVLHFILVVALMAAAAATPSPAQTEAPLPASVKAVWDTSKAYSEKTPTRERLCLNGLWRWQPAPSAADAVPTDRWGWFKVPGCWPGITDYMQKDSQTVFAHPSWKDEKLGGASAAWYQREITIPKDWAGRRITVTTEYLNSYTAVYVDGRKAGEMRFPAGEVDLTSMCQPGDKHLLSLLVVAMPLKGVMLSYSDTNSARTVKGSVERRGLCGDVYLVGAPRVERIADVKVDTSVRQGEVTFSAALEGLADGASYTLHAQMLENGNRQEEFTSQPFKGGDLKDGRMAFTSPWKADKLWDIHTPQNMQEVSLSLQKAGGGMLDTAGPVRFGFREFWIDGRDFYLNGSRIFLSSVPLDNAQVGAAWANYDAAKETLLRLKSFGINMVYTHNYGCEPGSHLSFEEILRAADDVGMLVSMSQPHFGQYDWKAPDADSSNGYARHVAFYVRLAQNHPSVVFYAMSHNATGYSEDMNPDMIDGTKDPRDPWSLNNSKLALRAEAIVRRLDPGRIVYHHSSGNLGAMHTMNFYANFAPIQELSDWFEHWSTHGTKPVFTCEYGVPFTWDWAMYRGWYKGERTFGNARVPWEFCFAEWNAQFLGDRAFRISEMEKANLRWEAKQFRAGNLWYRWDYPYEIGSRLFDDRQTVMAMYIADNWRAFRTWGLSANSPWEFGTFWKPRDGVDRSRKALKVDWENLQRPGFSPDYIGERYERMDLAFERSDWAPTAAGQALIRNNLPLLAYIGGKPDRFTSKDHNFLDGETVEKELIIINNSREAVHCDCAWTFALPQAVSGMKNVTVQTGQQERLPLRFELPAVLKPGAYELRASVKFPGGETQQDSFIVHVLPPVPAVAVAFPASAALAPAAAPPGSAYQPALPVQSYWARATIALFDPKGETDKLLRGLHVPFQKVAAGDDLSHYDLLIIGKAALTVDGPGPNVGRVRDGLKVLVFEQTSDVLEKRFGFRVEEYGLRQVFRRVPDHPILAGLDEELLRDWRGEATILPPQLKYTMRPMYGPTIKWCDIDVTRPWRCGCRGNVASVLIEKPARGDFLPILDGGFSLQYSPLLEYHEGRGMILFCQMDVTGRTEDDPAAARLARNLIAYAAVSWAHANRKALYVGDPAGKAHLAKSGIAAGSYAGGKLTLDQVLIVGPGGGQKLAASKADIAAWLDEGGYLLTIGLDEQEAAAFLPLKVTMKKAEHIATYFEPPSLRSPLAGIGPADVHNRDPRQLSLVTGGAQPIGDGVLATAASSGVVFCQLVPWEFDYAKQYDLKRTYRRASFTLTRLLANMGVAGATPILDRFSSPVDARKPEKRWLDGLYLDTPEEMDDPYRFFRW